MRGCGCGCLNDLLSDGVVAEVALGDALELVAVDVAGGDWRRVQVHRDTCKANQVGRGAEERKGRGREGERRVEVREGAKH